MNELIAKAQNVVFDIGCVLLSYDPERFLPVLIPGALDGRLTAPMLYGNRLWDRMDNGDATEEEVARDAARLAGDESLWRQVLPGIQRFHELMKPLPPADMIPQLRAAGKRVYALSNYGRETFARAEARFSDLFSQLDGKIISSHEHISKPDLRIYRLLCSRYHLTPAECVFIDDREANVLAAREAGMQSILYTGPESLL